MLSSLPDLAASSFYHCTPSQYKSVIAGGPTLSSMNRNMIPHVKSVPFQCCHFPHTSKLVNVTLGMAKSILNRRFVITRSSQRINRIRVAPTTGKATEAYHQSSAACCSHPPCCVATQEQCKPLTADLLCGFNILLHKCCL